MRGWRARQLWGRRRGSCCSRCWRRWNNWAASISQESTFPHLFLLLFCATTVQLSIVHSNPCHRNEHFLCPSVHFGTGCNAHWGGRRWAGWYTSPSLSPFKSLLYVLVAVKFHHETYLISFSCVNKITFFCSGWPHSSTSNGLVWGYWELGECLSEKAEYISQQPCLCSFPHSRQGSSQTRRGAVGWAEIWLIGFSWPTLFQATMYHTSVTPEQVRVSVCWYNNQFDFSMFGESGST